MIDPFSPEGEAIMRDMDRLVDEVGQAAVGPAWPHVRAHFESWAAAHPAQALSFLLRAVTIVRRML